MMRHILQASIVSSVLALGLAGCDSGDSSTDTDGGTHGTHDSHDTHSHETHGDTESAEAEVSWQTMPPMAATAGVPITASFTVETTGEIHVTELRACMGENHECGAGGEESFDVGAPAPASGDAYEGELTLTAGTWTVVGYTHVDADPHTSAHVVVTVE